MEVGVHRAYNESSNSHAFGDQASRGCTLTYRRINTSCWAICQQTEIWDKYYYAFLFSRGYDNLVLFACEFAPLEYDHDLQIWKTTVTSLHCKELGVAAHWKIDACSPNQPKQNKTATALPVCGIHVESLLSLFFTLCPERSSQIEEVGKLICRDINLLF